MKITDLQLEKRLGHWQQKLHWLGISHFLIEDILVSEAHPLGIEAQATVFMSNSYDKYRIWINANYLDGCTARELDSTLVHELVHLAMRDFEQAIDSDLEKWMPEPVHALYYDRLDHEREGFVNRVAVQLLNMSS